MRLNIPVGLSICLTASLLASGCVPSSAGGSGPTWSAALTQAKAERKPILLNFGGPW